jgi:hypothetical protein
VKKIKVKIEGIQPLLMHSAAGVDARNPIAVRIKEITSKGSKKRTSTDDELLDRLSYELSLYHNGDHVFIPDSALVGMIRDGAKSMRAGKEVSAGVDVEETEVPLLYDGPKDIDGLYEKGYSDRRAVVVNRARIMRIRGRFNKWSAAFTILLDENVMDERKLRKALEHAGLKVGLLDYRPRFGRFVVKDWKVQA